MVVAGDDRRIRARVDNLRIARIRRDVSALTAPDFIPILARDDTVIAVAGNGDSRVILLRSVDAIGPVIVHGHVIELRSRLVVLFRPRLATVDRDRHTAVVAVHDALRIRGIDPQPVMIAMRRGQQLKRLPAISGTKGAGIEHVHRVGVLRIGKDVHVVPGALAITLVVVHARPRRAGVIGTVNSSLLRLNDCVNTVGVGT